MTDLRPELPPLPDRMQLLPVHRGYPVPWFVTWLEGGEPCARGTGEPDFRVITFDTIVDAVKGHRCWVCGGRLGRRLSFVIGPMCAVNLNTSEPPGHRECADWSARACPFLSRPHAKRNDAKDLHGASAEHTAGIMIPRNPGVAVVWTTRSYRIVGDHKGGVLFRLGAPEDVDWYREGRRATREEVLESIESGLPALREYCDTPADLATLEAEAKRVEKLLPA